MQLRPQSISNCRLARLTAWAKLWLQWFAVFLPLLILVDPARARREVARCARVASDLVALHAARRVRFARARPGPPRVQLPGKMRAVKGSRLRRRLRARDPAARFLAVLSVMRDLDTEAARLARRLPRGLTRRCPITPAREFSSASLNQPPLRFAHAADTS